MRMRGLDGLEATRRIRALPELEHIWIIGGVGRPIFRCPGQLHECAVPLSGLIWTSRRSPPRLARWTYELDLTRVIVIGHSAGGHLALWLAARHRLPKNSPLYVEKPLSIRGAINLAGPANLRSFPPAHQKQVCGDVPITKLVGGRPSELPQRYHDASPTELLPLGVKQILITGTKDLLVPPKYGKEYEAAAPLAGDKIEIIDIEDAGHFEVIAPNSIAWPTVEWAVQSLVKVTR